jgi:hypothetical protein
MTAEGLKIAVFFVNRVQQLVQFALFSSLLKWSESLEDSGQIMCHDCLNVLLWASV